MLQHAWSAAADVYGAGHAVGEVEDGAAGGPLGIFGHADAEGREVEFQQRGVGDDAGCERGGVIGEPLLAVGHCTAFLGDSHPCDGSWMEALPTC